MSILHNKQILLGITGGIAAYKSAILARRLIDEGAHVRVVMTQGAQAFIQPMTFQALTGNPVHTSLLDADAEAAMGHIELARWADLILIAPASANTLARLAHGMADDLLSTLCIASAAPIYVAPAMNRLMWANLATKSNCDTLANRGIRFIGPGEGSQACGETGAGRLLEPEEIRDELMNHLLSDGTPASEAAMPQALLSDKRVLITAGPTREAIDPVRFISNHSSGKMGFAIADAARAMGADVTLVAGPVCLDCHNSINRINVVSAEQMREAVMQQAETSDVFISVAAVSDYRLEHVQDQKIKKHEDKMNLTLVKNPDILKEVSELKKRPFCVGFAAETENVEQHARRKLARKKLDMIAANQVGQPGNPVFGSDTNSLDVYWLQNDGHHAIDADSKARVAQALVSLIASRLAIN